MTTNWSNAPRGAKTEHDLRRIEALDDLAVRRVLVELAGSMFLTLSLQILDGRMFPQTDRQGRAEQALERIPNLTENEAAGVLVSLAGLKATGRVLDLMEMGALA